MKIYDWCFLLFPVFQCIRDDVCDIKKNLKRKANKCPGFSHLSEGLSMFKKYAYTCFVGVKMVLVTSDPLPGSSESDRPALCPVVAGLNPTNSW